MITVFQVQTKYCQDHNRPEPTYKELSECGHEVVRSFRKFILDQNTTPGIIINGAGFLVQNEYEKTIVVAFYPDDFLPKMMSAIGYYYYQKSLPKPEPPKPQKKRKRTPIIGPLKPAFSAKPSNINQRTI